MLHLLLPLTILMTPLGVFAEDAPADSKSGPPPADAKALEFFESRVRPILAERCLECHGPEKQKGNLRLDSLAAILKGGDSGTALVPEKPDESLLVQVIGYMSDIKMPPKSKLPEREIADLTQWIKRGAVWPNSQPVGNDVKRPGGSQITPEQRAFWAFQPPVEPVLPTVQRSDWPKLPIDRFILARLEAADLQPAAPVGKRKLIRRATFDLIGVPPTAAEVSDFLADESPDAFARVVDRLLASPGYGQRWGRHWLDVARYADSNGLDENLAYASAYRYRDYVIAAFNRDKPFNRFVEEQIAGDLLPVNSQSDPNCDSNCDSNGDPFEGLVATGFLCLGAKMLAEDDPMKMQMDIIDEQVDTVGRAFLGLTLGCARCHTHKFDPIPIEDYYSLAGIFKSTRTMENFSVVARWQERPLVSPDVLKVQEEHLQRIQSKQAEINRVVDRAQQQLLHEARAHAGDYLTAAVVQREWSEFLKAAKPIGADPAAVRERTARIIEAEDFTRGNVLKQTTGYGEGIGVIYNKGELPNVAEYDVEAEHSGVFQFELRYAAAAARPVKLLINGELVKNDAAGRVTGSWNPDTQAWEVLGLFPLAAGKNSVRLECAGPFPHIDKLLLAPARDVAGKPLAVPAAPADGYHLKPEFVRQWLHALELPIDEALPALAVWQAYRQTGKLPAADTSPLAARFVDIKPESWNDVALRYSLLFAESEHAWQELQSDSAERGTNEPGAKQLADPALESLRKLLYDPKGPLAISDKFESDYTAEDQKGLARLRDEAKELQAALPKLPEAMAVADGKVEDLRVHLRGSHLTLGEQVPRQFPAIFGNDRQPLGAAGSGRRELAAWLVRPENPLTSRVIVNRVWLWHFGEGLLRSPDNFGNLGERPTHPELLDWLARRFVEQGWSLKSLHRQIMLSATYQQASETHHAIASRISVENPKSEIRTPKTPSLVDPENRLLWHFNRQRLEAEALRDGLLATCGELDTAATGSLLPTTNRQYVTGTGSNLPAGLYDSRRRSIYLPVVRSALYEVFQAFDFADPTVMNGRRDATTVAPQALFMMNSQLVSQATRGWTLRLLREPFADDSARIQAIYELAYSRPPMTAELSRALEFVERYREAQIARQTAVDEARVRAWQSLCRAILSANEFIYVE